MSEQLPELVAAATAEQPGARAALAAALRRGPSHAYSFVGPTGSGKAAAARAFAAELLAVDSRDPGEARRRALADPSPHPDLTWLRPPGNQHLVEDVRRDVIGAVAYRPFEAARRVFVIEAADAMAEESQNALLKTLEEPPGYAHLILITAEPAALLETVRSRCSPIAFAPLPPESLQRRLAAEFPGHSPEELAALAALAGGDLGRARLLGSPTGSRLRGHAEAAARAAIAGELAGRVWADLLALAAESGKLRADVVKEAARERADEFGKGRDANRVRREGEEAAKRADRRARTDAIDLGARPRRRLVRGPGRDRRGGERGGPQRRPDRAADGRCPPGRADRGAAGRRARDGHPPAPAGQRQRGPGAGCAVPPGGRAHR